MVQPLFSAAAVCLFGTSEGFWNGLGHLVEALHLLAFEDVDASTVDVKAASVLATLHISNCLK